MKGIFMILAAALAVASAANDKKIVCYFGSWSVYRKGDGAFDLSYMDPKLCTHMIYTFIGLSPSGEVKLLDAWNDLPNGGGKNNIARFNKLREQNPSLKTMVAIGGWNEGSAVYSKVVADPKLRQKMVDSIVAFVKKYKFDGFDVDWEYPSQRDGSSPADKQNYVLLLKELRRQFDKEGFILSAAVGAAESSASKSYNIPEVSKYLHFINLMAYDLHGWWDRKTGMNAALNAAASEKGAGAKLNVDAIISYWLAQGAPAEKLVLGVPFYGRSFTLSNSKSNAVGAAATAGAAGPYTREAGMLGYNEICLKIKNDKWQVKHDDERKSVYAYNGNQWVSYDDEKTLKGKTDYIKKHNLGGAMVWSIETDDFRGKCGQKFPLLNTLHSELRSTISAIPNTTSKPKSETIKLTSTIPKTSPRPQLTPETPPNCQSAPTKPPKPQPVSKTPPKPWVPQKNSHKESDLPDYFSEEETSIEIEEPTKTEKPHKPHKQLRQRQWAEEPAETPYGQNCQYEGYVRDRYDCSKFYYCKFFNGAFIEYTFTCPASLVFDTTITVCNWREAVQC